LDKVRDLLQQNVLYGAYGEGEFLKEIPFEKLMNEQLTCG